MIDRAIKYIDGELSLEEQANFESDLKTQPELYEVYKNVLASKALADHFLEAEIRSYMPTQDTQSIAFGKKNNRWILIIGGILIGLALVAMLVFQKSKTTTTNTETLYAASYKPPIWPNERGHTDIISRAVQLHLTGNTTAAIELLLQSSDTIPPIQKYWAAEILIHSGDCSTALPLLALINQDTISRPTTAPKDRIAYLLEYCQAK